MQNMQLLNQENSIFEGLEGNHFENLEGSRFDNLEGTRFDSGEGSRFDNLEGTRFDSGESSGFDNPSWATGSAGALGRPPPPPPSTLPMMMGVQAAGAGGHSNLVNYGVLSGGMVRSPFSGMDLQYAPPLGPSLRPGALGGHAPRDIMRLMSEPASIYNSVGGGGGGGGGACSQFKPPVHMGSPPRPLSRAYSGPTTPMAQPTARASSRRSSCPPCNKGQPSPLTMLTLNLLTPSTGTGFFCPAIPASSTLNGRSLRPQRQRSRDSGPTSTGPRIPPPPGEPYIPPLIFTSLRLLSRGGAMFSRHISLVQTPWLAVPWMIRCYRCKQQVWSSCSTVGVQDMIKFGKGQVQFKLPCARI